MNNANNISIGSEQRAKTIMYNDSNNNTIHDISQIEPNLLLNNGANDKKLMS